MPNKLFIQPGELPPTAWTVVLLGHESGTCRGLDPLEALGGLSLNTSYGTNYGTGDGYGDGGGYGNGNCFSCNDEYGDGAGDGDGSGGGDGNGFNIGCGPGFGGGSSDGDGDGDSTVSLVSVTHSGRVWIRENLMEVLGAEQVVHPTE